MSDVVSIIGGGWSVRNHDLHDVPGVVIGVNDAALHAPRVDIILSMDRLWVENRWAALEHLSTRTFLRCRSMINMIENFGRSWLIPFENRHDTSEFGNHLCVLNGPNSGHCALNLAFVLKPSRINLYGFDMKRGPNGEAYWFPAYSWVNANGATSNKRYAEWEAHLANGVKQCEAVGIEVVRH
jgi:hypothetical protein